MATFLTFPICKNMKPFVQEHFWNVRLVTVAGWECASWRRCHCQGSGWGRQWGEGRRKGLKCYLWGLRFSISHTPQLKASQDLLVVNIHTRYYLPVNLQNDWETYVTVKLKWTVIQNTYLSGVWAMHNNSYIILSSCKYKINIHWAYCHLKTF